MLTFEEFAELLCRMRRGFSEGAEATLSDNVVEARRALVSVHDKTGIVEFARALADLGVEILSSGGTASVLESAGVEVTRVEEVTGAPEMLGGRVKTLHPLIHGGILADRGEPKHQSDVEDRGIPLIDLVVVNLYPFEATVEQPDVTPGEAVEQIDIGGPAMIRAGAKNHAWVGVLTSPEQYPEVLDEIAERGGLTEATRRALARAAFARTAAYDGAIVKWFERDEVLPEHLNVSATKKRALRYGENPHQEAAYYEPVGSPSLLSAMRQLGGKELSYNNIGDLDAAWRLASALDSPAAVVVKHANPCGVSIAATIEDAYRRAHQCDPQSAFGGVVALNRPVSAELANDLAPVFTEVVVAPEYESDALEILTTKKNLRVMQAPDQPDTAAFEYRSVLGGILVQTPDAIEDGGDWEVVSSVEPSSEQWDDLRFAWIVCANTKSNAIVLALDGQAYGIGAGDQSRVGSVNRAASQADGRAKGGVCASEAFFPFRDGVDAAVAAGATAIVEPGGSVRDDEVIAAANEHGVSLVFTGRRHFRHG